LGKISTYLKTTNSGELISKNKILLSVFTLALIIRLVSLAYCTAGLPPEQVGIHGPDSQNYLDAASAIVENFDIKTKGIVIFGPGYPVFLGILHVILGYDPIAFLIVQSFIGALSSVLLALLVLNLGGTLRAAFIAGFINAVSPVAVTTPHYFMSENLFFPLAIMALLFFIKGMKSGNVRLMALAGLTLALATLTRSVGQFLIFIFIIFYFGFRKGQLRKLKDYTGIFATIIVFALITIAWAAHNDHYHNFRKISFAEPTAMFKGSAQIKAAISGRTYAQELDSLINELKGWDNISTDYYGTYSEFAGQTYWNLMRTSPVATAKTIAGNLLHYLNMNYGLFVLLATLIAIIYLCINGNIKTVLVAGLLYFYFVVLSGFVIAQGPRIMYPAQIGWVVLIAMAMDIAWTKVSGRFKTSPEKP